MVKIDVLSSSLCTGCGTCENACPVQAIEMQRDVNGFLFPQIKDNCIDCGKCAKVCPALTHDLHLGQQATCYAVWADQKHRPLGSSGGVFSCMAEYTIKKGGIVYGAAFEKGCHTLHHIGVESLEDLPQLYKSKYVQSEIGSVYGEVKAALENSIPVLFSGCPCQVDGLKAYLGKEYKNLTTIDILCHGVPSPMAYNRFLDEVAKGREVESVDFRDKKYGWGTLINVSFTDGSNHYDQWNGNYFKAFLSGLSMRESCLHCQYAQQTRVGDITLGDFWGVASHKENWNDNKGTSLVMCNSEKGKKMMEVITHSLARIEEIPYEKVVEISARANAALVRPTTEPEMRKCFFKHLVKGDSFSKALRYAEKAIMDVGILGWWIETPRSNYGSSLTCYALYRYLSDEGYSVTFISPPGFDRAGAGKFNKENAYRMTAKYDMEHMSENNKYIDTFIVGSDVLWYYDAMIRSGYTFLLDFVNDERKKIAYSTSFGNLRGFFPKEVLPKVRKLISRFDHIAVREFEGVNVCKEHLGVNATHVLDPVFLTDPKHWSDMANKAERKTEGKFLFAYMLDPTPEKAAELKKLSAKKGLKLVSITDKQFKPEEKLEILRDCGVIEGASLYEIIYHLKNAEFIVTDSYHGYCFSLVFRRNYLVLVNRTRGGARFDTLGELFNIKDRFTEKVTDISGNDALHAPIDYTNLSRQIEFETDRSKKWLINAIESERIAPAISQEKEASRDELVKEATEYTEQMKTDDLPILIKLMKHLLGK